MAALFHHLNIGNNLNIYEKNRKQVWYLLHTIEYHMTMKHHSYDDLTAA